MEIDPAQAASLGAGKIEKAMEVARSAEALRDNHTPIPFPPKRKSAYKITWVTRQANTSEVDHRETSRLAGWF